MDALFGLNLFDLGAGAVILVAILYGALRGMARLVIGTAALVAAWILATRFSEPLALRWGARSAEAEASAVAPDLTRVTAFFLVFIAVVVVGWLVGWLVARALGAVKLRWLDRLFGAGLGLLVAILLVSAFTVPLLALLPPDGGALMKESRLAPYAVAGGDWLVAAAPERMRRRFAEVSKAMLAKALGPQPAPQTAPGASAPKEAPAPRPR